MNESDFENELRTLRPAPASKGLAERVAQAVQERAPTAGVLQRPPGRGSLPAILRGLAWAVGCAAAAAGVIASFRAFEQVDGGPEVEKPAVLASPRPTGLQRVATSRALIEASEEEFLCDDVEEPMRRMRFVFLERHTWTDEESGAQIAVEVPREDIFVVPVAMQ
jgi:hypothetical protein